MNPSRTEELEKRGEKLFANGIGTRLLEIIARRKQIEAQTQNPAEPNPNAQAAGQDNRAGVMANGQNNG